VVAVLGKGLAKTSTIHDWDPRYVLEYRADTGPLNVQPLAV
jgi:hypothetical protein